MYRYFFCERKYSFTRTHMKYNDCNWHLQFNVNKSKLVNISFNNFELTKVPICRDFLNSQHFLSVEMWKNFSRLYWKMTIRRRGFKRYDNNEGDGGPFYNYNHKGRNIFSLLIYYRWTTHFVIEMLSETKSVG